MIKILMGISGSGKSTWIKNDPCEGRKVICSADHFFYNKDGAYHWDPSLIGQAHKACYLKYVQTLLSLGGEVLAPEDRVYVDNTNTTLVEIAPYIVLAQALDFEIEIHHVEATVKEASKRNLHGVPAGSIAAMEKRLEDTFKNWPRHWPDVYRRYKEWRV